MFKLNFTDYMRKECSNFSIYRPLGTEDYILIYFPEEMIFDFGEKIVETEKNCVILFEPGSYHNFKGKGAFINSFVHFKADKATLDDFNIQKNTPLYPKKYEAINSIIKELKNEYLCQNPRSELLQDALMMQLLIILERDIQSSEDNELRKKFDLVRLNMVTGCTRKISMDSLAASLHLSKSRFYEHYKSFYDISPKREILKSRMELAKILLTNKSKTVKEVAFEVGFDNVEHFTRYYKKFYGSAPRRNINK